MEFRLPIGKYVEIGIETLQTKWSAFFDGVSKTLEFAIGAFEDLLREPPALLLVLVAAALVFGALSKKGWRLALGWGLGTLAVLGGLYFGGIYLIFPPELPLAFYAAVVVGCLLWQRGGYITALAGGGALVLVVALDALVKPFPEIPFNWYMLLVFTALTYWAVGRGLALFALIGLFIIDSMALWAPMIETLALVFAATFFALLIGIPFGIWASRSDTVERVIRPILDFMQTMPVFVYLIPAVLFFTLGKVPGAMATVIFAMPPAVRLTNLGIRQVSEEVIEAAQAFGSTPQQMLMKVQLPIALPTILAGVNQTIMLALSMVVIAAMIGAGGLGDVVLRGITQMKIGMGFEGGLAVVILAMLLDRVTQALGTQQHKK